MTSRFTKIARWDKRYVWHPFTQMQEYAQTDPLVLTRARGVYLYDDHGRRYLDGTSSLWVNLHGHRHPRMDRAIRHQLSRAAHTTLLGPTHPPAAQLAKELVAVAPRGLNHVFFSDDGSTAVEAALKMVYQHWQQRGQAQRRLFLGLKDAYHGDTLGAVSAGAIKLFHRTYRGLLFRTVKTPPPYCYRCPWGRTFGRCQYECAQAFEKTVQKHRHRLAGVVMEPRLQAAGGMIVHPPGYLKKIAAVCRRNNIPLILDEVAVGFGRTGKMFACQTEDVRPDVLCLAKGLTGGYLPMAATLVNDKIYRSFLGRHEDKKTFFHGHSYTGNPLAAAAALASLEIFKRERVLARLRPKIRAMTRSLAPLRRLDCVGEVRQCGFIAAVELVKDRRTKRPFTWEERIGHRVAECARRRGLLIRPLGHIVYLIPPLSISIKELGQMTRILSESIVEAVIQKSEISARGGCASGAGDRES